MKQKIKIRAKIDRLLFLLRRLVFKIDKNPAYFIYFVTGKCPQKCQHCFYKLREYSCPELGLDQIEKISRTMGRLAFLLTTGGEPFSRPDFEKIPGIFYRNNRVRNIAIPTNGLLTDIILEKTKKILEECPESALTINVSLHGINGMHDEITQMKGAFEAAVKTCKALVAMRNHVPNLDVGVCTVISSINQHKLRDIYKFVTKDLDIRIWAPFLTRGSPRNPETLKVNMEFYKEIGSFMKEEISKRKYFEYTRFFLSPWNTAKNALRRDIIYKIKTQNKRPGKCYAGKLIGVMFPDGQIKLCELREETFGNIKDFNYDFSLLWNSEKAKDARNKINSEKCFCTHECFLTMNLFFSPRFLFGLVRERLRLGRL